MTFVWTQGHFSFFTNYNKRFKYSAVPFDRSFEIELIDVEKKKPQSANELSARDDTSRCDMRHPVHAFGLSSWALEPAPIDLVQYILSRPLLLLCCCCVVVLSPVLGQTVRNESAFECRENTHVERLHTPYDRAFGSATTRKNALKNVFFFFLIHFWYD